MKKNVFFLKRCFVHCTFFWGGGANSPLSCPVWWSLVTLVY